jgi:cathepsin L
LSPQQLTDCAINGNYGCNGGHSIPAYNYVAQNGIISDSYYPYKAVQVSNIQKNFFDQTLYWYI